MNEGVKISVSFKNKEVNAEKPRKYEEIHYMLAKNAIMWSVILHSQYFRRISHSYSLSMNPFQISMLQSLRSSSAQTKRT